MMNYAGSAKAPIQRTLVCTQTDVSWVGTEPVTQRQRPALMSVPFDQWELLLVDVKKNVALS